MSNLDESLFAKIKDRLVKKKEVPQKQSAPTIDRRSHTGTQPIKRLYANGMTEEVEQLDEAKPKIISINSKNHPLHADRHVVRAMHPESGHDPEPEKKVTKRDMWKTGPRAPKQIDTWDPKIHKALEKHLGGRFEHFEDEPKHRTHTDEHGKKHASIHATVTHSYGKEDDLGLDHDTAETYPVAIHRIGGKYHVAHRSANRLGEDSAMSDYIQSLIEARIPLAGHPYHLKSDAELKYIVKDAGEAARVQKGMSSEAKYLDQVNDASTVLYHRKNKK